MLDKALNGDSNTSTTTYSAMQSDITVTNSCTAKNPSRRKLQWGGRQWSVPELARHHCISPGALARRLYLGMPLAEALTKPIKNRKMTRKPKAREQWIVDGEIALIPLQTGVYACIDAADVSRIGAVSRAWNLEGGRVRARIYHDDGFRSVATLDRVVTGYDGTGRILHRNDDWLDFRQANLFVCESGQELSLPLMPPPVRHELYRASKSTGDTQAAATATDNNFADDGIPGRWVRDGDIVRIPLGHSGEFAIIPASEAAAVAAVSRFWHITGQHNTVAATPGSCRRVSLSAVLSKIRKVRWRQPRGAGFDFREQKGEVKIAASETQLSALQLITGLRKHLASRQRKTGVTTIAIELLSCGMKVRLANVRALLMSADFECSLQTLAPDLVQVIKDWRDEEAAKAAKLYDRRNTAWYTTTLSADAIRAAIAAGVDPALIPEDANFDGFAPQFPTAALPGTEGKIQVMAERYARRERLFHPGDA